MNWWRAEQMAAKRNEDLPAGGWWLHDYAIENWLESFKSEFSNNTDQKISPTNLLTKN
jgi:hypothetical protein